MGCYHRFAQQCMCSQSAHRGGCAAVGDDADAAVVSARPSEGANAPTAAYAGVGVQAEVEKDGDRDHHVSSDEDWCACLAALESFDSLWAAWKADSYLKAAIAFEEFWQGEGRGAPADRRREDGLHGV